MPRIAFSNELTVLPIPDAVDPAPRFAQVTRQINQLEAINRTRIQSLATRRQAALSDAEASNKTRLSKAQALSALAIQKLENRRQDELKALETRRRDALRALEERRKQQLSQLAAQNASQLQRLESDIRRASITRAIERSNRRLETAIAQLSQLQQQLNSPMDLAISGVGKSVPAIEISQALTLAQTARQNLEELRISISNRADTATFERGSHVLALNDLRAQISAASAMLVSLGGFNSTGPQQINAAAKTSLDATQSAEELALSTEHLATLSNSAARMVALGPVRQRVGDISSSVGVVSSSLSTLTKRVDGLAPTPAQQLTSWMRTNAIFFSDGATLRNRKRARRKLDKLVNLLRQAPILIRVVGYTDATGPQGGNATLAEKRASTVAKGLRDRGIKASAITIVGRTNGPDLSADTGPTSPNRRVQFEIGLNDESTSNP